jgi:hypothetical protein
VSQLPGFSGGMSQLSLERFDGDLVLQHGRGYRHLTTYHKRPGQFQHDDGETSLVQPVYDACGQVTTTAYDDELIGK